MKPIIVITLLWLLHLCPATAQNSMTGDGFGGRSWYKAHNYQVGAYSAYTVCGADNQLYGWGYNGRGELGNGTLNVSDTPVAVVGMNHVKFYTTGYISAAIKNDNSAWVWGTGLPPTDSSGFNTSPVQVLADIKIADGGVNHVVFVKNDGAVWGVGQNTQGQLGNGIVSPRSNPVTLPIQMTGINNAVRAVAAGFSYEIPGYSVAASLILLSDGSVKITGGYNWFTSINTNTPVILPGLDSIVDIKAGAFAAFALRKNGDVYAFGREYNYVPELGALGLGAYTGLLTVPTKLTFPLGSAPIVAISANNDGYSALALDENRNVYGWGSNYFGQLGAGTQTTLTTPALIASNVIDIFAGETFSYILKSDSTLWATGGFPGFGSIWMNLSNIQRNYFTQINPLISPMNLCAPKVYGVINPCLNPPATPAITISQPTCTIATGGITITSPINPIYQYSIDSGVTYSTAMVFNSLLPRTYHVRVKDTAGCSSAIVPAVINAAPVTPLTPSVNVVQPTCATPTGSIAISNPNAAYTYSINGSTYSATTVFPTVAAGSYNVTAQSSGGCVSAATAVSINAAPGTPPAPVVSIAQPTCTVATGSITITAPIGAAFTYSIDGVDYSNTAAVFNAVAAGSYNVTARNNNGCTSAATVAVINAQPITPAAPSVNVVQPTCATPTGSITISNPNAAYTYSINGSTYSATTVFPTVAAGSYNVTAQSSGGCVSAATAVSINAAPGTPPAPIVSITQPTCTVSTGSITITAPIGAAFTYSIDGVDYSNTTGVFNIVSAGSFNVTVRNNNGCTSAATVAVIIAQPVTPPAPSVNVTQPTCALPLGTITVTFPIANATTYSIDGTTYVPNNVFTGLASGTYNVTVNNGNCISPATVTTLNAISPLMLALSATPNPVGASNTVSLEVTGNRPFTVTSWQPLASFPNQSATTQTIVVNTPQTFAVSGKTADDCPDTAQVIVTLKTVEDVWIPNTFTPDNNGRNDVFYVYGTGIDKLELTIWNQWGEKIFSTKEKTEGWDGSNKGKAQPTGVYAYVAKVTLMSGKEVIKKGMLNLVR